MRRCVYFLDHWLDACALFAALSREKRARSGGCYRTGCKNQGAISFDARGPFCWKHYFEEIGNRYLKAQQKEQR